MAISREKILEIARSLPPAPRVFSELDRLLRDANSALEPIAALIKRDASLAAHIIRISNSVAFGGEQKTGSVEEAVSRVGFQEIFRVVGEVASARLVDRSLKYYGIEADQLREQMLQTALLCEHLAAAAGLDERSAYTAGLMRPLGMLVIDRLADRYGDTPPFHPVRDADYSTWEGRIFGFPSTEVAAMVLTEWSFPPEIIDAVRNQYLARSQDLGHELACVVNLACGLVADDGNALIGETSHWGVNAWKLESIGLTEAQFHAAAVRGREAYNAFNRRVSRDVPKATWTQRVEPAAAAAPEVPAAAAAAPAAAPEEPRTGGAMTIESCNFPLRVRVVQENDSPPVPPAVAAAAPAAVAAPTDFTTFMRNYQDMVFATAARLTGNDAQAEDIAQEVFLKAYQNFDHLQTSPTAGGWLKTVATNLSLNHLSRYRNRWRFFSEFRRGDDQEGEAPEVEFAAPDTFFAGVDATERRELVDRALAELPPHQRIPLVLFHFEDMPYDAIAKRLGVSLAKVKTDILRARTALAKILTRGGTPHETSPLKTP